MEESLQGVPDLSLPLKEYREKDTTKQLGEDSWIIVEKDDCALSAGSEDDPLDVRTSLMKWCSPFSTSLNTWRLGKSLSGESQTAREHVQEAYTALDQKLHKLYGCSCDKVR